MPDKELTDAEIVKALECCLDNSPSSCRKCPLLNVTSSKIICSKVVIKYSLDLINRLQAEIDRKDKIYIDLLKTSSERAEIIGKQNADIEELKSAINGFRGYEDKIKAEAYKEFAEKLHEELRMYGIKDKFNKSVFFNVVDKAKKELVGEDK